MSSQPPPNPFPLNPIFNIEDWVYSDATYLTYSQAVALFLLKGGDSATGLISFNAGLDCNGIATFNSDIVQNNSETNNIVQNTRDTNTNQNIFRKTDIYGDLNLRRPTSSNGGAIRLWDVNGLTGYSSQLYNTGSQFAVVNLNNDGLINFYTKDNGGNTIQPFIISPTYLQGLKQLLMQGTLATDRIINNCYYQLQDTASLNTTTGQIYASNLSFIYDNDRTGGNHTFATNNSGGVQTIPLQFSSADFGIATTNPPTCSASYVSVPSNDASTKIPTTAWVQGAISAGGGAKVYTTAYTSTQNVTIPTGVFQILVTAFGRGGASGVSVDTNGGHFNSGGSGGGGSFAISNSPLPVNQGTILSFTFDGTSGTGYSQLIIGATTIVKVFNGYNGGNASGSAGGSAGAGSNGTTTISTTYATWTQSLGTIGTAGGIDTKPDGGRPTPLYTFQNGFYGCGQSFSGSLNDPALPVGVGAIVITYYKY